MRIQWYGQSAFALTGAETSVFVDPFGDMSPLAGRGMQFDYLAIDGVSADLLLVTHEHLDHNGVEVVGGDPTILRSTAGKLESPVGDVVAIASEHDQAAGTERGPNTIFVFSLDGLRVAHFGDFGQAALRDEQAAAIGEVDLIFLPVGGGPTVDAAQARAIVDRLSPKWVVPMHYRTPKIGFLEPADAFIEMFGEVRRFEEPSFETGDLPAADEPVVVVPAAP
ncbi:MAG TPA: MBL fold metallo-hydrolase [Solirubrobacteraceae bacterium]|nr:MBL fold metallo-hydrolase [Solirubrobacteraceae bacterium]